jgi:hypothetical protein
MHTLPRGRLLGVLALLLAGLAFSLATSSAGAHQAKQRLVVRGDSTIVDGPCPNGVCAIEMTGGKFRGTIGAGDYRGAMKLTVVQAFPNGEGGVCAPIEGEIALGAGTPNRLVLSVDGESCQDGAGPVTAASFTGLAHWQVKYGTGIHDHARGRGLATFLEDAADHDRMTLIGWIR